MKRALLTAIPFFLVAGLLTGCNGQQPETSQPEAPLPKGQQLFLTHCVSCHQGVGNPPGPNSAITTSSRMASQESFISLLRKPTSPMMRSFSPEELPDTEAAELYNYLKKASAAQ